ncbi:hypothetical protein BDB01DRAFT_789916 [Pilobolus umbonatus]|nr:hypothetical protein BDB01DRAFT_789916 [Pilobolus umbonatus]
MERDHWSIKLFQVKYTTQKFNRWFSRIYKLAPTFWNLWFSLGVIAATLTMVVGTVVIIMAGNKILGSISEFIFATQHSNSFSKREIIQQSSNDQVFLPMIPGVTLPMSHIGYYLFALTVCGVFHEGGHAVASFSQGVSIQSSGMFIMYLYPGAFVNIPDHPLSHLRPFNQLKIICAGVWHNLVLYAFTQVSLMGGLKLLLLVLGWKSLEGQGGVGVVHMRPNSPLAAHLPPSTVIYQLDDFPLTNNIEDWNTYLFDESGRHDLDKGFCVAKPVEYYAKECCDINDDFPFGQSSNASVSCFSEFPLTKVKYIGSLN